MLKMNLLESWNSRTIDEVLQSKFFSKKVLHLLRMNKDITLNGKPIRLNHKIEQTGELILPDVIDASSDYARSVRFCDVVYEDDYVAIVVKQRGVKTHPNEQHELNTLMNHAMNTIDSDYLEPIHRLDQETKGLLILCKHPYVKSTFDTMLDQRLISRFYIANVHNNESLSAQTIDLPIGKDSTHANKRRISNRGQQATTHIVDFIDYNNGKFPILKLDTGRQHQIRVHLEAIGHSIIGDPLYSDSHLRNLALCAYKIEFVHPYTEELISVEIPLEDIDFLND